MRRFKLRIVARSNNAKTGDMPTAWIGNDLADSRASCVGCPQLENKNCYSQYGSPSFAIASIANSAGKHGEARYGLDAIDERSPDANAFRVSAIGDPARADRRTLRAAMRRARKAGLGVVGYTHFWRTDGQDLKGQLMASCDGIDDARNAINAGWRVAVVMPVGTTGTRHVFDAHGMPHTLIECPAIAASRHGKTYTCNDCASGPRGALCDAAKGPTTRHVYFADHGPKTRAKGALKVIA